MFYSRKKKYHKMSVNEWIIEKNLYNEIQTKTSGLKTKNKNIITWIATAKDTTMNNKKRR